MNQNPTIDMTGGMQYDPYNDCYYGQQTGQAVVQPQQPTIQVGAQAQQASPQMQAQIDQTRLAMEQAMQNLNDQEQKEQKATGFLNSLRQYIGSVQFQNDVNETAQKYNLPAKAVATNFFEKALGTVGDILGVAITVVRHGAHSVVNIAAGIAHGIIDLICNIATGIGRMVTFNKTCQPIPMNTTVAA